MKRKTPRRTLAALRRHVVLMVGAKRQAERCLRERDLAGHCVWAGRAQYYYRAADSCARDLSVTANDWRQTIIHNMAADVGGGWYRQRAGTEVAA